MSMILSTFKILNALSRISVDTDNSYIKAEPSSLDVSVCWDAGEQGNEGTSKLSFMSDLFLKGRGRHLRR